MNSRWRNGIKLFLAMGVVTLLIQCGSLGHAFAPSPPDRHTQLGADEATVGLIGTGLVCVGVVAIARLLRHKDDH